MKVMMVVLHLGGGGAERSLQELLPGLAREGIAPEVASFEQSADGVTHLVEARFPVHRLRGPGRASQLAHLRQLLATTRPDLVHTTLFLPDVLGRPVAASLGIPVLTSLVNMPFERERLANDPNVDPVRLFAVRALEVLTGGLFATHFHAVTEAVKGAYVRSHRIPPERITVVQRGRDRERLGYRTPGRRAAVRASLGLQPDALVLLSAGRQEYQKGQRFLLEAMPAVLRLAPGAVLLIAGQAGNASDTLKDLTRRLGLESRVRLLGYRQDVPDLMVASDVFCLPSLWEGTAGAAIEAMALGLPIVAADIPPLREVSEQGAAALLAAPGEAAPLCEAILRLVSDPTEQRRLAACGEEIFERTFTLERSVAGMAALMARTSHLRGRARG